MTLFVQINKRLVADSIINIHCPNCNTAGVVQMVIYQKYANVFFVPWMPAGKDVLAKCNNCSAVFIKKQFNDGLKQSYKDIKKGAAWWMYSGLTFALLLIVFAVYMGIQGEKENEILVLAPEQGHVYDVKLEDKVFTLLKVTAVKGDSVYLVQNQYASDDYSGFNGMRDKPYSSDVHAVPKKQIKDWYDSGFIRNIHAD